MISSLYSTLAYPNSMINTKKSNLYQSQNQTDYKVWLPNENCIYSGGTGDGQNIYVTYTADSRDDDPIVRIRGTASDGSTFDFVKHINEINPKNASYAEMCALIGYQNNTGAYSVPNQILSPVTPGTKIGDYLEKKNFVDMLQSNASNPSFSPSIQKTAQTLQALYTEWMQEQIEKRGEELANKYFNISYANKPLPSESQIKELKDKYGDVEFTKEQYQSFLQDLTSMGVISDIESQLAGNESAMQLCIPVATAMVSPTWLYYSGVDLFQLDENTDVTEWIKYRAACDTSYFIDGVAHESSVDELYGYISNIISKIN